MATLRIFLFGCPRISHDGAHWPCQQTHQPQVLLAYLLLHGQRLHPRDALAALLWGDASEERARSALRTTLWRLRSCLEPRGVAKGTYVITTHAGAVGLNWDNDLWCDVRAFESGVQPATLCQCKDIDETKLNRLKMALDLYTGELLEGFYDDWIIRERERLRSLYSTALIALMQCANARGDWKGALSFGQRILADDPLRESIHREVIHFHLRLGQRVQALRQYEQCVLILKEELDIEPMAETCALYPQIVSGSLSPSSSQAKTDDVDLQVALTTVEEALETLREATANLSYTIRACADANHRHT